MLVIPQMNMRLDESCKVTCKLDSLSPKETKASNFARLIFIYKGGPGTRALA